ncbi:formyltransferase family protein [Fluviicola sp.]|uniref:methionyl-tRNA formyltransferase n=1 Tax=Fluviicola sp. TaxID=1917219 RepID=UPI0031D7A1CE
MSGLKIAVLCGGRFALPAIQQLAVEKYLCGIAIGNGDAATVKLLDSECEKSGLPFQSFPTAKSASGLENWLEEVQPDAVFSICFPYRISEDLLTKWEGKFINFHTGPLPQYRGPMPIFEVLRYKETETAISVHFMNAEFDEGDLIFSEKVDIAPEDNFGTLAGKLSFCAAMSAQNMAQMLEFGSMVPRQEQDENHARYFEKPEWEDTFIQWNRMDAAEILQLIKACNPWNQGADTVFMGNPMKIIVAHLGEERHQAKPGTILQANEHSISVACLDGDCINVQVIGGSNGIVTAGQFNQLKPVVGYQFN